MNSLARAPRKNSTEAERCFVESIARSTTRRRQQGLGPLRRGFPLSLVNSITEAVRTSIGTASQGVRVLAATANLPVRDLESAFVSAAEKLNYQVVLEDWRRAQSALGVDPADAATRACRLLESLCKHILQTCRQPSPASQNIQKLFKAAARSLNLSPDQQSSNDLQTIASGIFSIAVGVGALRTHAGTAHGSAANRHEVNFSEARLAVNSAGAVGTFLMEALLSRDEAA